MKIDNELINENNKFKLEWRSKRKLGFIKYFVISLVKFFLFSFAIILGSNLLNQRFYISVSDICVITLISILAPMLSWFINETRYKI